MGGMAFFNVTQCDYQASALLEQAQLGGMMEGQARDAVEGSCWTRDLKRKKRQKQMNRRGIERKGTERIIDTARRCLSSTRSTSAQGLALTSREASRR